MASNETTIIHTHDPAGSTAARPRKKSRWADKGTSSTIVSIETVPHTIAYAQAQHSVSSGHATTTIAPAEVAQVASPASHRSHSKPTAQERDKSLSHKRSRYSRSRSRSRSRGAERYRSRSRDRPHEKRPSRDTHHDQHHHHLSERRRSLRGDGYTSSSSGGKAAIYRAGGIGHAGTPGSIGSHRMHNEAVFRHQRNSNSRHYIASGTASPTANYSRNISSPTTPNRSATGLMAVASPMSMLKTPPLSSSMVQLQKNVVKATLLRLKCENRYDALLSELEHAKRTFEVSSNRLDTTVKKIEIFEWNLSTSEHGF